MDILLPSDCVARKQKCFTPQILSGFPNIHHQSVYLSIKKRAERSRLVPLAEWPIFLVLSILGSSFLCLDTMFSGVPLVPIHYQQSSGGTSLDSLVDSMVSGVF